MDLLSEKNKLKDEIKQSCDNLEKLTTFSHMKFQENAGLQYELEKLKQDCFDELYPFIVSSRIKLVEQSCSSEYQDDENDPDLAYSSQWEEDMKMQEKRWKYMMEEKKDHDLIKPILSHLDLSKIPQFCENVAHIFSYLTVKCFEFKDSSCIYDKPSVFNAGFQNPNTKNMMEILMSPDKLEPKDL